MPKITYVEHDGTSRTVDLEPGLSVMKGAIRNNIPGIDAECGGQMSCATCHVHVDREWTAKAGPPREAERTMLEFADDTSEHSRLSCQIRVSDELDGLIVRTPESQG
ncbi:2Fe-2S iron-sulfur cluster-binding protein [Actinomadura rubrisoli]|uniref:2Fe-2S iron-sulfur cluster binding domain-containing protein n=1 Tax=Actinomadura rubrisoli TaxID=2530368 RepID=A0A4R5C5M2_9ACTN|nr:2Fe-2S iron-sulfur cluster-binding protein [Actinomadura rubrisoli]TDD92234.1 2Fe-2S iron-sulfur cluster binding domain-containing protein [Actinomadura rubrisoli]